MIWIVVGVVVVGLVCLAFVGRPQRKSVRGLGKDAGHSGSARYKNRGSAGRKRTNGSS
jgi:hypothetical protein